MQTVNSFIRPLLTDLYQLTMAYGYWKADKHQEPAVFDLHFRKNPFAGEFTVFAGLEAVLHFLSDFRFSEEDIDYLKESSFFGEKADPAFFSWLSELDCSEVKLYAMKEGTLVFPQEPLLRVEGPLGITQLLETTLLNLVNYPSLMATNAARFRLAAGKEKLLLEFGLRRAQGPDGGVSASRYSYIGGFNATSNVLAGKLFKIPVKGTTAHSFISSFSSLSDLKNRSIVNPQENEVPFVELVQDIHKKMGFSTHEGELASFIAYAQSFPHNFVALVDTYDTLGSGIPNFISVATALTQVGYSPVGIRLDSGDLAYLSKKCRKMFTEARSSLPAELKPFPRILIVASNDINEATLVSLNQQGHEIDAFGIGTHLVTCQAQPALGCVYKLVELNGKPRLKLSQEIAKVTIPGKKEIYRLSGMEGYPLVDLMTQVKEPMIEVGQKILCRDPFKANKRVNVIPNKICRLHQCYWDGKKHPSLPNIHEVRDYVLEQLDTFRPDHLRQLNPTPYKVAVDDNLFQFFQDLWLKEAPIMEIS